MASRPTISLLVLALLGSLASGAAGEPVPSGHRAALLVGNAEYEGFTLPGVQESLDRLEGPLEAAGYAVTRHENLANKDEQRSAVERFVASVPTNGVALVYYVGLGAHLDRNGWQNLLRPTGEAVENDGDYRNVALNVQDHLLRPLRETSGARRILVFLDACWDSPIRPATDAICRGLHEVPIPDETLLLFAAPSGAALPPPNAAQATHLAAALARRMAELDSDVRAAASAIATATSGAWFANAIDGGLGAPRSHRPVVDPSRASKPGASFINSLGMVFRWCPPGSFTMGSVEAGDADTRDRVPVEVVISRGFWMGEHEVTQREYRVLMRRDPPPGFTLHPNAPYYGASESKTVEDFCRKLNEHEREAGTLPAGWEYAGPTEAEWEYACRAGSTSRFSLGDSITELAAAGNFADQALREENPEYHWADSRGNDGVGEALAPVGSYQPNAWGLHDMHGNVAEIVADHWSPSLPGGRDPLVRLDKDGETVIRGGAWCSMPGYCESSFRNTLSGRGKSTYVGFRVTLKKISK